jgi:CheY-like chemotaxis protein
MKIMIEEDDKDTSILYQRLLEARGHQVMVTNNGEDCLRVYHNELQSTILSTDPSLYLQPFDTVVLDYNMHNINGMEVAKEI